MPQPADLPFSKGEIDRSGDVLRAWWPTTDPPDPKIDRAWHVVTTFRACFQYPMTKTAVGMRQFVQRESQEVIVAQRLKRTVQILNKLVRMPDTKLARMEDIGGCRAILGDQQEIERVLRRIRKNWQVVRVRDYIAQPKTTGYRGVHVVIDRDGRRIEIQLRTFGQQAWAEAVERTAGRLQLPLKDGDGPDDLLEYFKLAAEGIARDELGIVPDADFDAKFDASRRLVVEQGYFGE